MGSKTTSSGWPDPSEWVRTLSEQLGPFTNHYLSSNDPHQRRLEVGRVVGALISSLEQLPPVKATGFAVPLRDLLDALVQLEDGGRPDLLTPRKRLTGAPIASPKHRAMKAWSVLICELLIEHGRSTSSAAMFVSQCLTKSGRTARKGRPITDGTIERWWRSYKENRLDPLDEKPMKIALEQLMALREQPHFPSGRNNLEHWARDFLLNPRL